jgi:hypothetical protein
MRRFHFSTSVIVALLSGALLFTTGCGTSDLAAAGPGAADSAGGGGGGDGGSLQDGSGDGGGGGGGGGGLCGDGTCDLLETPETCPLDCKGTVDGGGGGGGGGSPIECLQKACAGALQTCSLDAKCAQTLGCIASCSDAACLGACRQQARAGGPLNPTTAGLFACGAGAGCGGGGGGGPVCGDGVCDEGESCPSDCGGGGPVCGNGVCEKGEDDFSCPVDCFGGEVCGDGVCSVNEPETCPEDCVTPGPVCGNGACEKGESPFSCPKDCGQTTVCGDGICNGNESPDSCPQDCGGQDPLTCAKEQCPKEFATCTSDPACAKLLACFAGCSDDGCYEKCLQQVGTGALPAFMPLSQCAEKVCSGGACGDGFCDDTESPQTCPADCQAPPVCGNGKCDDGENPFSCPKDCGGGPICGNGTCEAGESAQNCPQDCFSTGNLLVCAKAKCEKTYIACSNDAQCNKALDCIAKCTETSCINSCAAQNTGALQLLIPLAQCAQQQGCLSGGGGGAVCGNGKCEPGESAQSCPKDCQTGPVCGNGQCEPGEGPQNCPSDCQQEGSCVGKCGGQGSGGCWCDQQCAELGDCCSDFKKVCSDTVPVCGDGKCNNGESANSCPQDCKPVCGNGQCEKGEQDTCPKDCGPPPPVCGDGACAQPFENENSCPKDCASAGKPCKSKADCAASEICCNGSQGQICTAPAQCF